MMEHRRRGSKDNLLIESVSNVLKAVPKLAPPEPPNRGGAHKKGGPVVLFNQRMIKVP